MNVLLALLLAASAPAPSAAPHTFRVDYFHTGNATEERFSLDRLVVEPLPWPGNPTRALDETNLGKYLFEVRERETNRLVYSRGFASIYGEWESTAEAQRGPPHLPRVPALSHAAAARAGGAQEARPGTTPFARCGA